MLAVNVISRSFKFFLLGFDFESLRSRSESDSSRAESVSSPCRLVWTYELPLSTRSSR